MSNVSLQIETFIDYIESLQNHKCNLWQRKFCQLSASEKESFLEWGNYSIAQNQTTQKGNVIILDDSNQPFSKKGLKRVLRRWFDSLNRANHNKKIKNRRNEKKKHAAVVDVKELKFRKLRSANLRAYVQYKLDSNPSCPHIVLDCRFDAMMDHQQIVSVASQIRQLYGRNMKAPIPSHLYATSFGQRLKNQFREKNKSAADNGFKIIERWKMNFIGASMEKYFEKEVESKQKEFVYLTADSENELERIEESKIYVIGAFVDKNKYKGYTHKLAQDNGWKTARLPILKYMKVADKNNVQQGRLVITINQVFTILLALYNWKDWRKALQFAFPTRKGLILKEPLSEQEIEKLVFNGHLIDRNDDRFRRCSRKEL